jgi:hypothetical protein
VTKQTIEQLVETAFRLLSEERIAEAFKQLIKAKAMRQSFPGLDLLRAKCFLRMSQSQAAIQALLEELAHFPSNEEARRLLEQTGEEIRCIINDEEFKAVLKEISNYTMLSQERLYSLFSLAKRICNDNLPGNFVECGVARGGSAALVAYVIKKYSALPRLLFAFDTFAGMPEPTAEDMHNETPANDTGWGTGTCAGPVESLMDICRRLGAEDMVLPIKGYFQETLPMSKEKVGKIALLHLDGDWYESTKAVLDNLYDNVIDGGFIQVDDYGYWAGCRKALHEFANERAIRLKLQTIDATGVCFRK